MAPPPPLLLTLAGLAAAASSLAFGTAAASVSPMQLPTRRRSWTTPAAAAAAAAASASLSGPRGSRADWGLLLRCRGGAQEGRQDDAELRRQIEREDQDLACVYQAEEDAGTGEDPTPQWTVPDEEDEDVGDGSSSSSSSVPLEERAACIVIDPFSSFLGKHLKRRAMAKGLACVDVLCPYTSVSLGPGTRRWRPPAAGQEAGWAAKMPFRQISFVLSESDVGTATAERLQVALGVRGNGINPARRNKYTTNLALKSRGAASTRQVLTGDWAVAEAFLAQLQELRPTSLAEEEAPAVPLAVVKPARGAASGDVRVCYTVEEAKAAFDAVLGAPTYGGGVNDEVLVQEYLQGQEWAVDTVSSDGETKVLAVWRYDKRAANGAPCVYFGTMLEAAAPGSEARRVAEYVTREVLPALGVRWGPTHTEVIVAPAAGRDGALPKEKTTPVVVECNCRWHLAHTGGITDACLGANAVDATLDAFVDPGAWARLPAMPEKLQAHGRIIHLVCFGQGRVTGHRHLAAIEAMDSVRELEVYAAFDVGEIVTPTIDIRSDAGYVLLVHEDLEVLERDYQTITAMQPEIVQVERARG